jgi:hypothetical protein
MSDLLAKISKYHIFNFLVPGSGFAYLASLIGFDLIQPNPFFAFFSCYLFGLIISRIGSIAVEPIMLKTSLIAYEPHSNFVDAAKADPKIDSLLEINNMYRSLIGLGAALFLTWITSLILVKFPSLEPALAPIFFYFLGHTFRSFIH